MKNVYELDINITTNMLDRDNYVKPSALLDAVQFVSGEHAELMSCGYNELIKKGIIWIVIKTELVYFKKIKDPKKLKFITYPLKRRLIEYPRDTEVYYNDELIALIRSIWLIFDLNKKAVSTLSEYEFETYKEPIISKRIKRIENFELEKLTFEKEIKVVYSQIDHNDHLNNTRYVDFFLDVFKADAKIKCLNVEYLKQVYLDEVISIYSKVENNKLYLYGFVKGEKAFAIKGEMENEDK